MNALPPSELDAYVDAMRAKQPDVEQLLELSAALAHAAMTFAGRCMELQRKLDACTDPEKISAADIVIDVCREHGVTVRDVKSPSRMTKIVNARREVCVRLRAASFSNTAICRILRMDQTSVCYALKRAGGMTHAQIKASWAAKPRNDLWTTEEVAIALRVSKRELTLREGLAQLNNRTENGLRKYLSRNGLPRVFL